MPTLTRRDGFTLAELLLVIVLLVPLWTLATGLATTTSRAAARSVAFAAAESSLQHAAAIVTAELTSASPGRDLLLVEPARIRLHAARGSGVICRADSAGVVVSRSSWAATRLPVPGRDSLLVERIATDSSGVREKQRLPLAGPAADEPCAAAVPGLRIPADLASVTLSGFTWGPLARTDEVIEIALYTSDGLRWLGIRHLGLGTPIEPVAGPFAAGGVRFTGLDGAANPTADPAAVRALRVRFETAAPARLVRELVVGVGG
jgi:hypothetical protein